MKKCRNTMDEFLKSKNSIMKNYLLKKYNPLKEIDCTQGDCVKIRNAQKHNLKSISVNIALNKINVVTGVSGSGKSSLIFDVLLEALKNYYIQGFESNE